MRHISPWLTIWFVSLGLAACGPLPMQPKVSIADPGHLTAQHKFAVDVRNFAGSVRVEAVGSSDPPSVVAIAHDAQGVPVPATWAAAAIEASDVCPVLRVLCTPPAGRDTGPVQLTIRVPSCEGVRVQNASGPVSVIGVRGAVDVQNGTAVSPGGDVQVIMGGPLDAPAIVRNSSGSIVVTIRPGSRGVLDLQAGGAVTAVLRKERAERVKEDRSHWTGVLNEGEHPVVLSAERGDVLLRVVK